jgi:hypothetical protein
MVLVHFFHSYPSPVQYVFYTHRYHNKTKCFPSLTLEIRILGQSV